MRVKKIDDNQWLGLIQSAACSAYLELHFEEDQHDCRVEPVSRGADYAFAASERLDMEIVQDIVLRAIAEQAEISGVELPQPSYIKYGNSVEDYRVFRGLAMGIIRVMHQSP